MRSGGEREVTLGLSQADRQNIKFYRAEIKSVGDGRVRSLYLIGTLLASSLGVGE